MRASAARACESWAGRAGGLGRDGTRAPRGARTPLSEGFEPFTEKPTRAFLMPFLWFLYDWLCAVWFCAAPGGKARVRVRPRCRATAPAGGHLPALRGLGNTRVLTVLFAIVPRGTCPSRNLAVASGDLPER